MIGLAFIPYSYSIQGFLNPWPINSDPWSCMISIDLGYIVNHVVYTKFAIDIAILASYCVISNRPITGYIKQVIIALLTNTALKAQDQTTRWRVMKGTTNSYRLTKVMIIIKSDFVFRVQVIASHS